MEGPNASFKPLNRPRISANRGKCFAKPNPSETPWSFAPGAKATLWKDICFVGCKLEEECKLDFVAPSVDELGKSYAKITP